MKRSIEDYLFSQPDDKDTLIPYRPEFSAEAKQRILQEEARSNAQRPGASRVTGPATAPVVDSQEINVSGVLDAPEQEEDKPYVLPAPVLPEETTVQRQRPLRELLPPVQAPSAPTPEVPIENEGQSAWTRALVGATPLLVGLMTGNPLEGVQVAAGHINKTEADIDTRHNKFIDKINELKWKRQLASTKDGTKNPNVKTVTIQEKGKNNIYSVLNGQKGEYLGEAPADKTKDSVNYKVMINPATAQPEIAELIPNKDPRFLGKAEAKGSFDFIPVVRPETGKTEYKIVNKQTGDSFGYMGEVPEKADRFSGLEKGRDARFNQQKKLELTKEFSKPNSIFNKKRENVDGIVKASEMLNSGSPLGATGLRNYIARNVFGEKGPLSDGDITRLSGDPSAQALVKRTYDKWVNGKLDEPDRTDVYKVLQIAHALEMRDANSEAERYGRLSQSAGFDITPTIKEYTKGALKPLPSYRSLKGKGSAQKTAPLSFEEWKAQKNKGSK